MKKRTYETAQLEITIFNDEKILTASAGGGIDITTDPDDLPIMPAF